MLADVNVQREVGFRTPVPQRSVRTPHNEVNFKQVLIGVNYQTDYGQDLWLVGSTDFLGNWNP